MTQHLKQNDYIKLEKEQFSRLLYPNPVCLLTSYSKELDKHNIMTISWLTALDNDGRFLCSMNQKRSSAELVLKSKQFVLNVPIKGMENLLLRIGRSHGAKINKFEKYKTEITPCDVGWTDVKLDKPWDRPIAIKECVAHMDCVVDKVEAYEGHFIMFCRIVNAFVKKEYWSGKVFCPQNDNIEPFLTFFGSQRFGYVRTK